MEGPRAFRLRTLEANLVHGSFSALLDEEPNFSNINADQISANDWIYRLCRWCPHCLQDSTTNYGRIGWEIRFADACAACGHWLLDRCSACGDQVSWSRNQYASCRCGAPLQNSTSSLAPKALVTLCRALEMRALGNATDELPILNGLSLHQCLQLIRWLGTYGALAPQRAPQKLMTSDSVNISWPVTTLAAEVIASWPTGFVRLLEQLKSAVQHQSGGSLQRTFQGFYHALYAVFRGPEFLWLRRAFEDYVAEHWNGSIGRRNRRLYDRVITKMEWIPTAVAAQQLGISVAALHRLGSQGQLDLHRYETTTGRQFSKVSRTSLKELIAGGSLTAITLLEAAKSLGLKRQRLQSLLTMICPEAFKLKPTNIWMIPRAWLAEILLIIQQLPEPQSTLDNQWVTLDWLFRYEAPSELAMGALINALRHGTVQAAREKGTTCMSQIHVLRSEVQTIWTQQVSPPTTRISLMEAASRLRIKQEVVYTIARSGLLEVKPMKIGRRESLWLDTAELDRFSSTYVFARDLAAQYETSSRALAAKLRSLGIKPVAGPGVDTCRQLIFRTADIENCEVPRSLHQQM